MLSAVLAIVNPSVHHMLALCQNDSSYDHGVMHGVLCIARSVRQPR